jgi:hypothetical protein
LQNSKSAGERRTDFYGTQESVQRELALISDRLKAVESTFPNAITILGILTALDRLASIQHSEHDRIANFKSELTKALEPLGITLQR